jgi:acetyltransferase-like isoleucine patch superfamily enzyme
VTSDISYFLCKVLFRLSSYARGLWLFFLINMCGGKCKGVPRVGKGVTFKYPPHSGVSIGAACDIGPNCYFDIPPQGRLKIGDNVKLTAGVVISAVNDVQIGDNCLIAEWVSIRDAQHLFLSAELIRVQALSIGSIVLESDVWLGRGSAVFINSTLEQGCIVAANSIVKEKRLASYMIYAGIPIREISARKSH